MCLGKYGLLNKNYCDYIDIIDQGAITFNNFAYISAILGPILTGVRPQWCHRDWQQKMSWSDLQNLGQGHDLQKYMYISYYTTDFTKLS